MSESTNWLSIAGRRAQELGRALPGSLVIGMDLSLNHGALVCLRGFDIRHALYSTERKNCLARAELPFQAVMYKSPYKERDRTTFDRLVWWGRVLNVFLKRNTDAQHVGIEDYAFTAVSSSAYQYGELGGLARWLCRGRSVRPHDPLSVKLFAAGRGDAAGLEVEAAVRKKWGQDFRHFNATTTKKRSAYPVSEDLAAAYTVAMMVQVEVLLRRGILLMSDLDEHAVRVFNRVTKAHPVNLLGREWLTARGAGAD